LHRRSISYIVVLRESTPQEDDAQFLRQTVFERLNTGGVKLEKQEIRNCLYQSKFNSLLNELSQNKIFRSAFGLPEYSEEEKTSGAQAALPVYEKMEDVENILRFFALRHSEHYTRGMNGFLDLYMTRAMTFNECDINHLRELFTGTIETAYSVYGEHLFKPYDTNIEAWKAKAQRAYFDAVMVSFSTLLGSKEQLISSKAEILEATKEMFITSMEGAFTGRGNTKGDIQRRIGLLTEMLQNIIKP